MKVTIDPESGLCFGVNRAILTAESELAAGNEVYSLGEIVHNQAQMDRLKNKGLKVVTLDDFPVLKGEKVLIRAHGEPPETFQLATQLGITLIDATCPIVTKLQKRIKEHFVSGKAADMQIVIYGKPGHAEVAGLNGNAGNTAIIVNQEDDLKQIDYFKPVTLFSQTTMDNELYLRIAEIIQKQMDRVGNKNFVLNNSVCRQVSGRAPLLRIFAAEHDVIIFVSGKNSANGAYLFSICKEVNEKSYQISDLEEINYRWFENSASVGVSGATSTPAWQLEEVALFVNRL